MSKKFRLSSMDAPQSPPWPTSSTSSQSAWRPSIERENPPASCKTSLQKMLVDEGSRDVSGQLLLLTVLSNRSGDSKGERGSAEAEEGGEEAAAGVGIGVGLWAKTENLVGSFRDSSTESTGFCAATLLLPAGDVAPAGGHGGMSKRLMVDEL
jgi:hypothetical protein